MVLLFFFFPLTPRMHLVKAIFPKFPSVLHVHPANYTLIDKAIKGHFGEMIGLGAALKIPTRRHSAVFPWKLCVGIREIQIHTTNFALAVTRVVSERFGVVCVCLSVLE